MKNLNLSFDYATLGARVINIAAIVVAVTVALYSYVSIATQLWWEDHGQEVKDSLPVIRESLIQFASFTVDAVNFTYAAGRQTARFLSKGADIAFYAAAGI